MVIRATHTIFTVVDADHKITLPADIPPGTTVVVVPVPPEISDSDPARRERFAATMAAIEATIHAPSGPTIGDVELDARIERARRATTT